MQKYILITVIIAVQSLMMVALAATPKQIATTGEF